MTKAIILAHKEEKAMKSTTPVYLHDLLDKAMIDYVLEAMNGYEKTLVIDPKEEDAFAKYHDKVILKSLSKDEDIYSQLLSSQQEEGFTIISNGNTPMIGQEYISQLVKTFHKTKLDVVALTINLKPTGVYCIDNKAFTSAYKTLNELIEKTESSNHDIINEDVFFPITNRLQLSNTENDLRREIIKKHLFNGVTVKNIDSVTIGPDVEIEQDSIIYPNTYITGKVKIGKNCKLGPFLRIRQAATLGDGVKIGNFVELKNATMGDKSASAHLSYLGDATIGKKVNIGCGVITVNYDGAKKHHTTIEDEAFIGCNANLIAPVTIGSDALVAAGSTVTKDVAPKSLCFARARQVTKEGYKRPKKA